MVLSKVYLERCDKETEETIAVESPDFLNTPIAYFKTHLNEFLYVESPTFEEIKVDALSIEVDDVFRTYMALFGLRVQKKHSNAIKNYLEEHLHTDSIKNYSALFSADEGLWEINLPLDFIEGFQKK
ncbi:protoporphyrinogen oxidase [Ureibacillus thermophilus]|uniref:Protoporphyrinogen oxidase n=1 Tax=Ureibacillus thermophilus TaxID=367743 RepID=A0A4P6UTA3_9BACL|nr:protoporphyrinogen oxidase [Ureibacillus thermophilus]QBK26423.1 protoporphyrinogen oxidase [Ureibacillus thermophilus]